MAVVVEVTTVPAAELAGPLKLLERFLRGGEPLPETFSQRLRGAVEAGDLEVLAALAEGRMVGVAVLAYRLNVSAASLFVSIEDLYVKTESRRRGVGRALLEAIEKRCKIRGVSYVEVQTDDEAAAFYAAHGYEPETGVRVLSHSYAL